MKIIKQSYVEYVISTPVNYTCTNLAEHVNDLSHDAINDYLRREKHTAHTVWELAEPLITNSHAVDLILDDSVQDQSYSQKIEMVKRQYSGNAHGLVKGIGIVNLVHTYQKDYNPLDFRVYAPTIDGRTKNEHFRDILRQAFEEKGIKAKTVLFDCWYAASENLKFIHKLKNFCDNLERQSPPKNSSMVLRSNSRKFRLKCSFSRSSPQTVTLIGDHQSYLRFYRHAGGSKREQGVLV